MIIFDECHHTADDHAYNKIMTEFYFFYKKVPSIAKKYNFPIIYGLTASPIKTGIKGGILESTAYDALQKLSENLDCVIVIDPDMINSNAKEIKIGESIDHYLDEDIYIEVQYHTEIKEYKLIFKTLYFECFSKFMKIAFSSVKVYYPEYSNNFYIEKYREYLMEKFKSQDLNEYNKVNQNYDYLYNLRKYSPFFLIFEKLLRQIFMILENLCLDSLISYFGRLIQIYYSLYQRKTEKEETNSFNKSSISLISLENEDDDDETDVLRLSTDSIDELIEIYSNVFGKLKEIKEKTNYISDRLKKLFVKIKDLFSQNKESKFIIFIANRIVAHFLKPALSSFLKNNFKNKQCDEIIGINKRKSEGGTTLTPSLTLKKLNEIITNFNEDKFDILIGTSAIEEGLDIQSCNAVLALVEINTPKTFIQVKGRARKSNSHFYIFTNSTKTAKLKVKDFITMGKKMKELFNGNIVNDFRSKDYISKKPDFIYDMDTKTHSKITWGNVSIFFNEIKQQIESKGVIFQTKIELQKVKSLKGNPEFVYKGIINLSTNLKNLQDKFPYQTKFQNDKDSATKMCQLYLLNVLKKSNYLDSHLKFIKN
jgi:endoribonuclease Dicer